MTATQTQAAEQLAAQVSAQATANAAKRQGAKIKTETKSDAGAAVFGNIGKQVKSTMVSVGGTNAEPEKVDAASFPAVTMKELGLSGSVLQNLAFNFLAGTVDGSITTDTLKELPRALRNEKGAIVGLLGKKSADIRAAWEKVQSQRKRIDKPTLRALWAAVKDKKPGAANGGWKEKVAKILDGKQSDKMKMQMLRELLEESK